MNKLLAHHNQVRILKRIPTDHVVYVDVIAP